MRFTSSSHLPCVSNEYVCELFAFHSARPSVVSAKHPTCTLFRTTHGVTTSTLATITPATACQLRKRQRSQAASTSGRATSRVLPRTASPHSPPASTAVRHANRTCATPSETQFRPKIQYTGTRKNPYRGCVYADGIPGISPYI